MLRAYKYSRRFNFEAVLAVQPRFSLGNAGCPRFQTDTIQLQELRSAQSDQWATDGCFEYYGGRNREYIFNNIEQATSPTRGDCIP